MESLAVGYTWLVLVVLLVTLPALLLGLLWLTGCGPCSFVAREERKQQKRMHHDGPT